MAVVVLCIHFEHIWYIYQSTFSVYAFHLISGLLLFAPPVFIHFRIYDIWWGCVEGDCLMYASLLWLWEYAKNVEWLSSVRVISSILIIVVYICIIYAIFDAYTFQCISKSVHLYMRALNILLGCWYEIIYSGWYVAGVLYQSYRIRYTHLMGGLCISRIISTFPSSLRLCKYVYVLLIGEFLPFLRFSLMDMWTEWRGKCNVEVVAYIFMVISNGEFALF